MHTGDYQEVEIERDGKRYAGRYLIIQGKFPLIEVSYRSRKKTTQLGGSPPELLARIMVRELVDELAHEGKEW